MKSSVSLNCSFYNGGSINLKIHELGLQLIYLKSLGIIRTNQTIVIKFEKKSKTFNNEKSK